MAADANRANRLIWAVFWRFTVVSVLVSLVVGFVIGFAITMVWKISSGGAPTPDWVSTTNALAGGAAGLATSFFVLRWVVLNRLGKEAGGLRLMLVGAGEPS